MASSKFFDDLQARVEQIFASGPARDVERNVKTAVANALAKFDVASRDELEIQRKLLTRATERIAQLDARITELEAKQRAPN